MREMKDSGIEWIGEIPKEWGIVKFKYLHNGLNTGEAIDKEYWESDAGPNAFYTAGLTPIRTGYSNFPTWKETGENDLLLARNGTPYVYLPVSKAYYTDHIIRAAMSRHVNRRFIRYCLVQNKHSTRSGYEASETMLIFVIMGGQWMDGFFGEPSARAVNSPPPSCYKDSIEQVAPAMPRARHEPN